MTRFDNQLPNVNYQATFLNRPAQEMLRLADLTDQLMHVRHIAVENIDQETGKQKLNFSTKMGEDYFSFTVEFLSKHGDVRHTRVVLSGTLAERALADNLKKGDLVRCTGLFGQDQKGIKPFYGTKYTKTKAGAENEADSNPLPVEHEE